MAGQRTVAGWRATLATTLVLCAFIPVGAQTLAVLQGRVFDTSGAFVAGAVIHVRAESIGFSVSVRVDSEGRYYVLAIPNGTYAVTAEANGFRASASKR